MFESFPRVFIGILMKYYLAADSVGEQLNRHTHSRWLTHTHTHTHSHTHTHTHTHVLKTETEAYPDAEN